MKKVISIVVAVMLLSTTTLAATVSNSYVLPQMPRAGFVQFLQGVDAPGVFKLLYLSPVSGGGSRCYGGWVTSSDSIPHSFYIRLHSGGIDFGGSATNLPASAGFSPGAPAVDWMDKNLWPGLPIDEYFGVRYIHLNPGDSINAVYLVNLNTGTTVNAYIACWDYP
jgi:hypothetical protein